MKTYLALFFVIGICQLSAIAQTGGITVFEAVKIKGDNRAEALLLVLYGHRFS